MARAPVSKTGGWGFESLHSCHRSADVHRDRFEVRMEGMAKINPLEFCPAGTPGGRQGHLADAARKTVITTAMVFVMVVLAAIFFFTGGSGAVAR